MQIDRKRRFHVRLGWWDGDHHGRLDGKQRGRAESWRGESQACNVVRVATNASTTDHDRSLTCLFIAVSMFPLPHGNMMAPNRNKSRAPRYKVGERSRVPIIARVVQLFCFS